MGVFYLGAKPQVAYSENTGKYYKYQYDLDAGSVEYVFNPSVTEVADIKNITQELVATEKEGLLEDYSTVKLYTGQKLMSNLPLVIQGVRVSFDVVPKDGGKTVHIVKTFQADIVSAQ